VRHDLFSSANLLLVQKLYVVRNLAQVGILSNGGFGSLSHLARQATCRATQPLTQSVHGDLVWLDQSRDRSYALLCDLDQKIFIEK